MAKYQFDHVHLTSDDPLKTAKFYESMFGAKRAGITDMGKGRIIVRLDVGTTRFLISQPRKGQPAGLAHFGIRADNLQEAVSELKAKGVKFTMEITEIRPGLNISFLLAPEDVPIELQSAPLQ